MSDTIEKWRAKRVERQQTIKGETRPFRQWLDRKWSLFIRRGRPWEIVTAPFIYSLILPFAFIDFCVTMFQWICFPIYRLPRVKRSNHIVIDRHKLRYLNVMQKFNCIYCGYCNGVVSYVQEVAGRTEYYWCPVKHAKAPSGTHRHYKDFMDYNDGEDWDENFIALKARARACEDCSGCSATGEQMSSHKNTSMGSG